MKISMNYINSSIEWKLIETNLDFLKNFRFNWQNNVTVVKIHWFPSLQESCIHLSVQPFTKVSRTNIFAYSVHTLTAVVSPVFSISWKLCFKIFAVLQWGHHCLCSSPHSPSDSPLFSVVLCCAINWNIEA